MENVPSNSDNEKTLIEDKENRLLELKRGLDLIAEYKRLDYLPLKEYCPEELREGVKAEMEMINAEFADLHLSLIDADQKGLLDPKENY